MFNGTSRYICGRWFLPYSLLLTVPQIREELSGLGDLFHLAPTFAQFTLLDLAVRPKVEIVGDNNLLQRIQGKGEGGYTPCIRKENFRPLDLSLVRKMGLERSRMTQNFLY